MRYIAMSKRIKTYDKAFEWIVDEFIEKFYTYDDWSKADYYIIWQWGRLAPGVVDINEWECFWDIWHMYEAIKNDISKEKLEERYEYSLNKHHINTDWWDETIVNLTSFALWAIEYTKQEREEDEQRIEEIYKKLKNSIEETKSKVTRIEVIWSSWREYTNMKCRLDQLQYQDNWRTLKIFISNKKKWKELKWWKTSE